MIANGAFKKDIVKHFKITNSQYKVLMSKLELKSNKETSIKIIDKDNRLAECSDCKEVKSLDEFPTRTKSTGCTYYFTYCYECTYKKKSEYINSDINIFLSERYLKIKGASTKKNYIFNIAKEDFVSQYKSQNGMCFYTDLPMVCLWGHGKQRDAVSVDKIIPELGYVKNNVVFCLNRINMAKHDFSLEEIKLWMPDWHRRIMVFFEKNKADK